MGVVLNKPTIHNHAKGPEAKIQAAIIKFLRERGWFVNPTHGNMFQRGFPDLYAAKRRYGPRWIEVKVPHKWKFTPAQWESFPRYTAEGVGIWILTAATEKEYKKLFQKPNLWIFMGGFDK